ncbi:hypothetical protein A4X13_0g5718 [Tilletia indica]|uniref:Uncharacterized protein n=1 Tax=Tilletia indica TaxID=43049 RepID=A0A177TQZ0_9BASI|nr:hypothetical protein A4X13_0g5718 [Tilletia indica]
MLSTLHPQRVPFGLFPAVTVDIDGQNQSQFSTQQHSEPISSRSPLLTPSPSSASFPLSPREEAQNRLLTALSASTARRRKDSNPETQSSRLLSQQQNPRIALMTSPEANRRISMPAIAGSPTFGLTEGSSDKAANARAMPVPSVHIEVEQDEEDDDDCGTLSASSSLGGNGLTGLGVTPKSFAARRAAKSGNVRIPSLAQISKYVDNQRAAAAQMQLSPSRTKPGSPAFLGGHSRSVSSPASPTLCHTPFRTNDGRFEPESSPSGQTKFSTEPESDSPSSEVDSVTDSPTSLSSSSSDEGVSMQDGVGSECGKVTHSTTNPPTSRGPPRPTPIRRPFSVSHQFGAIEVKLTPPTPMIAPLSPPPHHRAGPPPSPSLLTTPTFHLAPGHKMQQEQAEAFWKIWMANAEAATAGQTGLKVVSPRLIQKMQIEAARASVAARRKAKQEQKEDGGNGFLAAPNGATYQSNGHGGGGGASPISFPAPLSATTPTSEGDLAVPSMMMAVPSFGAAAGAMLFPHFGTSPPASHNMHMASHHGVPPRGPALQRTRSDTGGESAKFVPTPTKGRKNPISGFKKDNEANLGAKSWRISCRPDQDQDAEVGGAASSEFIPVPRSAGPVYHRDGENDGFKIEKEFSIRRVDSPPSWMETRSVTKNRSRPGSAGSDASTVVGLTQSWRSTPTMTPSNSPPPGSSSSSSSSSHSHSPSPPPSAFEKRASLPSKPSEETINGSGAVLVPGRRASVATVDPLGGGTEYVATSSNFGRRNRKATAAQQPSSSTIRSETVPVGKAVEGGSGGGNMGRRATLEAVSGEYVATSASFSRSRKYQAGRRSSAAAVVGEQGQ